VTLKAPKPASPKYPKELKSLGDHIRKRRLDLGLFQKQVAEQIGVSEATIYNWERNETQPQIHQLPEIICFLGYNPLPAPESLTENLHAARKALGLTQRAMAKQLGVDPTTLGEVGKGEGASFETGRAILAEQALVIGLRRCSIPSR
jgi:DNA-binding XRE family transcriptional regulator